jgi:hypothetical protein
MKVSISARQESPFFPDGYTKLFLMRKQGSERGVSGGKPVNTL